MLKLGLRETKRDALDAFELDLYYFHFFPSMQRGSYIASPPVLLITPQAGRGLFISASPVKTPPCCVFRLIPAIRLVANHHGSHNEAAKRQAAVEQPCRVQELERRVGSAVHSLEELFRGLNSRCHNG